MPSDSKNKNRSRTFQAYVCVTEIDGNTVVAHGEAFDELYRSINALLERRGQSHLSFAIYLCHISFYGQGRTTKFGARAWHWPIITLYQLIYVTTNFIWCFQTRVLKTTGVTFEKKMKPWLNIFDPINLKWVSDAYCIYSISQEICIRFCCALLCCGYAIVHNEFTWSIYPYSSGLLCWHWGNR